MDLRAYYKKVRDAEATVHGDHVVTVSLETPEGGKAGVKTEAPRDIAARLIAEGRARLASDEESHAFYQANREALEAHEQDQAAKRVQVMVIPANEIRKQKERS